MEQVAYRRIAFRLQQTGQNRGLPVTSRRSEGRFPGERSSDNGTAAGVAARQMQQARGCASFRGTQRHRLMSVPFAKPVLRPTERLIEMTQVASVRFAGSDASGHA